MKRFFAILLCMLVALSLTACGSGSSNSDSPATDMSAREMYDAILEAAPMNSPLEVEESVLTDLFYIDASWTDDYVASMAQMNVSADNLAVVHATEGNVQNVEEALQKRIDDERASFERYLPEQSDKAAEALLITKGDWVFMAINDNYDAVKETIESFFN